MVIYMTKLALLFNMQISLFVVGVLLLTSLTLTFAISSIIAEAVAQESVNEPQEILLNTVSVYSDENGTITKIINNSRTIDLSELRQALDNETVGASENALAFIFNNITGSVRIEHGLNNTNTAVVEESRKVGIPGEVHKPRLVCLWFYFPSPWPGVPGGIHGCGFI